MSRFNHKKDISPRRLFSCIVVTLAAAVLLVYFLPREGRSGYQFDLNRPWRYSTLMATFDFPIYKSESMVMHEKDSVLRYYEPYFALHTNVEQEQIARLRQYFKLQKVGVPKYYLTHIEQKLRLIYARGVVSTDDINRLNKEEIRSIYAYENNEANEHDVDGLFTHTTAYKFLLDETDSVRYNRYLLQRCNLNNYIVPNLTYDKVKSEAHKKDVLATVTLAKGMVQSGQRIVDRGEIVNEETFRILQSFEKESQKRSDSSTQISYMFVGQVVFVSMMLFLVMFYFILFRSDYLEHARSVMMLFSVLLIFPLLTYFLVRQTLLSVYIIPLAMSPIFIRVFMDSRTAFMINTITVLLCAVSLRYPFEFIATQVLAGTVAIYSLRELSQRSQLVQTAFYVTLAMLLCYFSLDLIHEKDITHIDHTTYIYICVNGVLLLFAYPALFLIEKLFGFTSNVTLVELSNVNNKLLRQMSEVAPGTFQHSIQVSNLASEVANRVGAKSQLVRTGALYHDIGKIKNAVYFTENQNGVNMHDHLSCEDSAQIVISHVKDGLELAKENNLPQVIQDFISTHHGTGKTRYFYISYKNQHPDEEVNERLFSYDGPNPHTLEQAILMMADAVEAASRSLKDYTEHSISDLVEKIIDSQVQEGFFKQCPITFMDIYTAKEVFKEKLKTIYHTRISYPELQNEDKKS